MQEIFKYNFEALLLYVSAFAAGSLTAVCYCYILYKSLINTVRAGKTAATFIIGYMIRILLCCACFAAAAYLGHIIGLAAGAGGFFITRALLLKFMSSRDIFYGYKSGSDNNF